MDRLEAMSILVTVAEAGSFSAASRKLGTPLPTVSRKVSELEAHLKTRLLVRSTRKLTLTDAGQAYVTASKRILEQVSDAEADAAGEYSAPKGDLVITAPIVFGRLHVLPLVNRFLASFPDINVRLVLSDRNVNLIDDHVDMAIRIGALPDSGMIATRVGSVRRIVCASPDYLKKNGTPHSPAELVGHSCISFDMLSSGASWTFATADRKAEQTVPIRCRLSVSTAEAAIDAAIAGVGLARLLSYQVTQPVTNGRLRLVLKEFEPEPMPVSVVHAGRGLLPLKMRSFLDFAVPQLRKWMSTGVFASRK